MLMVFFFGCGCIVVDVWVEGMCGSFDLGV